MKPRFEIFKGQNGQWYFRLRAGTYRKCGLMRAAWSGCGATDILAGAPACERFEDA